MTKKDFELIARCLRQHIGKDWSDTADEAAKTLADALATTNPLFARARFLRACGVQS